ncbi:YceD family protein [Solimonas soli]|uniref:YceD family protein n=1 Tax=Solimonas soli TaxID=413479 RepID=UPI000486027D|nr:YceD family protein [Solimonas soli]
MPIPQSVRASTAVAQQQAYRGTLPVCSFERLLPSLADDAGELGIELQAGKAQGRVMLQGTIGGTLTLRCLRCEQAYAWPVDVQVDLRLVDSEEEEQAVLHEADPYLVQDDQLLLREIVEDELLLALPMLPRCETCENIVRAGAVEASPETQASTEGDARGKENPFAALKGRLGKQS